ncbi:conserved hypothetical protein; putative transmembrane protein [Cupriavidus taiwanensis]|uniref:Uncharacterized protein n=1 Tax=Cupriavidus taiwanensis TaxID=164546 RepID=A0A976G1L3_9BURK|nr:hypothetical protein [Cupriavidus taiwanensis]SOZ54604.1 conserved hypothetical protein; putative transmembrane protein [Cupriavidus taiwanensis]SOZ55275.1 conserved hypothetical protein; putative transmembrane protein [Cupriavidus taiwanensis]SOZ57861.1 conserved hypothetical protein; putative transmembrane protein [Cupriavidus taiwanensis]SPA05064.1 conserved hypothetical protein; putative transmembrane protein [Cupriavidus taiwanensis]
MPSLFPRLRRSLRNDSETSGTLPRVALMLAAACAVATLSGCMVVGATVAVGSAAVSTVATVGSAAVSVASTAVGATYDVTAAGVKAMAGSDAPAPQTPPPQAPPPQGLAPQEPAPVVAATE